MAVALPQVAGDADDALGHLYVQGKGLALTVAEHYGRDSHRGPDGELSGGWAVAVWQVQDQLRVATFGRRGAGRCYGLRRIDLKVTVVAQRNALSVTSAVPSDQ